MQVIKIVECEKSLEFFNFLVDTLSKKYLVFVSYYDENPYFYQQDNSDKPVIHLSFTPCLDNTDCTNAIVFLKNFCIVPTISLLDKSTTVICGEDYMHLLSPIARFSPTVYTCGYSIKNHISISSLRDGDASISLLRAVKTVSGGVVQPAEYVLNNTNSLSSHEILGATLLFLITNVL